MGKTIAIVEICYEDSKSVPENIVSESIESFLSSLSSQMSAFSQILKTFCISLISILRKRESKWQTKAFA